MDVVGGSDALRIIRGMEISMGGFLSVFGFQFRRTRTPGAQRATDGGRYTSRDHDRDGNGGNCCRHCPAKVRLGATNDLADIEAHDGRADESAEQDGGDAGDKPRGDGRGDGATDEQGDDSGSVGDDIVPEPDDKACGSAESHKELSGIDRTHDTARLLAADGHEC